jgi:hypothetical protein
MIYDEFVKFEEFNRDTIRLNKIYVDINDGDLIAGLLLSQVVYWNLPSKETNIKRSGEYLVKQRTDWINEIRITAKQYDRAAAVLKENGFIDWIIKTSNFYQGKTVPHIKLNADFLIEKVNEHIKSDLPKGENGQSELPKGKNRFSRKVKTGIDERSKPSISNITTDITSNTCADGAEVIHLPANHFADKKALHNKIKADFQAANNYYHDVKEAKAIDSIINRALYQLEDKKDFAAAYKIVRDKAVILWRLIQSRQNDFYAQVSFLPSILLSQWNKLKSNIEQARKLTKAEEILSPEMYEAVRRARHG